MKKFDKAWDWLKRNSVMLVLITVGLFIAKPSTEIVRTMALIIMFEGLALSLSGAALYAYTRVNFLLGLTAGEDRLLSAFERTAFVRVIAAIFIGVHILVGLAVLGVYIVQFSS